MNIARCDYQSRILTPGAKRPVRVRLSDWLGRNLENAMDVLERHYYEFAHGEALGIARQLAVAPHGVTAQHVIDLNRFCDCCEDDEGYDVPKERMRALRVAGLVKGGRFGWYTITDIGQQVRDAWFDLRPNAGA